MKKNKYQILILVLLLCIAMTAAAVMVGCSGKQDNTTDPTGIEDPERYIELDESRITLDKLNDYTLHCNAVGVTESVVWTSQDTSVATVEDGKVVALAEGETEIVASAGDQSAKCTVVVQDHGVVPAMASYPYPFEIKRGNTFDVTPRILFAGMVKSASDAQLTYEVADTTVATVDANGVATALQEGSTTFTVSGSFRGIQMLPVTGTIQVKKNITIALNSLCVNIYACNPDGTYETQFQLESEVYVENARQSGAKLTWSSADEKIATVENGLITGHRAGTTMVNAAYTTAEGDVVNAGIVVNVLRPVITMDDLIEFDLSNKSGTSTMELGELTSYVDGMFTGFFDITEDRQEITGASYDGKLRVPNKSFTKHGYRRYALESELVSIQFNGLSITKKIYSVNDLTSISVSGNTLDGYYRLEKDIDAGGRTVQLIGTWSNSKTKGFVGIFEGNGHTISNVSVGSGGLFNCIGAGTVRNLGLANVSGSARLLASEVHGGTIENIAVSSKNCEMVFGYVGQQSRIANLVAILDNGKYVIQTYGSASDAESTVQNFLVVAGKAEANNGWSGTRVPGIFYNYYQKDEPKDLYDLKLYESKEALIVAARDDSSILAGFNFGIRLDGSKLYYNDTLICRYEIDVQAPATVHRGTSCKIIADNVTFRLKYPVAGITVNSETGVVWVSGNVPEFTKFTVVLQHKEFEDVQAEVTITVTINYKVVKTDVVERYDLSTNADSYGFTIPGFTDTFKRLGWQGTIGFAEGITVENGTFTLSAEAVKKLGTGDGTLCVYTMEERVFYIDLVIADKFLYTYEDLAALYQTKTLDGYYMLAADIEANNKTALTLIGTWSNQSNEGFIGTFNGDGHVISNLKVGASGLFGYIGTGTVKNLALVNVTGGVSALADEVHGMTAENLFVSSNDAIRVFSYVGGSSTKNVVAALPQGHHYITTDGSASDHNSHKNIYVVMGDPVTNSGWSGTKVVGLFEHYYSFNNPKALYNLKHYDTAQEMLEAMNGKDLFASWSGSSFSYRDGGIYFNGKLVLGTEVKVTGPHNVHRGQSVTLSAENATFAIKEPVDGITVEANGKITARADVPEFTTFTVVVTHKKHTGFRVEWEMTVTIDYKVIDKTGTMHDMDLSANQTYRIEIPGFTGTFKAVSWMDGKHITQGVSMEGNTLVITPDALKALGANSGILRVYTMEETAYHLDATVATKIIYDLADLKSVAATGDTLDGYYLLGADVTGNGAAVNLVGQYSADETSGFIGTLDGRGHSISDINVGGTGLLHCTGAGTVKNLALVDITGTNCVLANEVHGTTFENIFISSETCLRAVNYAGNSVIKNVLAVLPNGQDFVMTYGAANVQNTIRNVYTVMASPVTNSGWSGTKVEGFFNNYYQYDDPKSLYNLRHYRTLEDLFSALDANNTLNAWKSIITYANGAVLFDGNPVLIPQITVRGPAIAYRGQTTKLTSPNAAFSLKEAVSGITVAPDGTITVAADVAEFTEFTVVASHKKYTQQAVEWKMTVWIDYNKIDLTDTPIEFDLSTNAATYRCMIPGFTGTFKAVGWEGGDFVKASGISVRNGRLTITKIAMAQIGSGSGTLYVYTEEENAYLLNMTIADAFIDTVEELKSIAKGTAMSGYYVLNHDIDCGGETIVLSCYTSTADSGFTGTFDGRGHTISNVSVGSSGLFFGIGSGTVKNLALKNVIGTNSAIAQEVHGATVENVFVSSDTCLRVIGYAGDSTFKNMIAVLPNGKDIIETFGAANVENTISNVYSVIAEPVTNSGWSGTQVEGFFCNYYKFDDPKSLYNLRHYTTVTELMNDLCNGNAMQKISGSFGIAQSCLTFGNQIMLEPFTIRCPDEISRGSQVTAQAPNATFALKEPVNGVRVNASTGVITVDSSVAYGTTFTVTAVSSRFPGFSTEKTVTVVINWNYTDWTAKGSLADMSKGAEAKLTLPGTISGRMMQIACGRSVFTEGFSLSNGELTLTSALVEQIYNEIGYGDHTLELRTDSENSYKVAVTVFTKIIGSYEDLASIKANQVNGVLDGYYILSADIDATGKAPICLIDFDGYINNKANSGVGFVGIFDGRGHTISNLTVKTGGYAKVGGLFGQILNPAVVRNVAFTDMTTDGATAYKQLMTGESCRMTGLVENVFISAKGNVDFAFGLISCDPNNTELPEAGTMRNVIVTGVDYLCFGIINNPSVRNVIAVANNSVIKGSIAGSGNIAARDHVTVYKNTQELKTALNGNNVLAAWGCSISYANGKLLFNGKVVG